MTSETNGPTNEEVEQLPVVQIPIEEVDALADSLGREYDNSRFRKWYCGVIYEFGLDRVEHWRQLASTGKNPGGLFGYYVKRERSNTIAKRGTPNTTVLINDTDTKAIINLDEPRQPNNGFDNPLTLDEIGKFFSDSEEKAL